MNAYVVSKEDLAYNVRYLQTKAGKVPVWAVVKADGYGLGVSAFAKELYELGIRHFCVTELSEAVAIRELGLSRVEILMLRQVSDPDEILAFVRERVILTVGSLEAVARINAVVNEPVSAHLKIDTGMGRYGFRADQLAQMIAVFREGKQVQIKGVYTHFNCAYCDEGLTKKEFSLFQQLVDKLQQSGCQTGCVHCCNSSAFLKYPEMHLDAVRLGSALLGRMPFSTELRPLGIAETCIEELHEVKKGNATGYGRLWTAKSDRIIAILPVGWSNGLQVSCKEDRSRGADCIRGMLRELRNLLKRPCTTVTISGKSCPIVGAIGSLHCAVDVTDVDCSVGQKVELPISPMHRKGLEVQFR